jgi:NAD(P)H-hydrate epimerase
VIIDAIVGVGFKGVLRDLQKNIITKLNDINAIKIAIDIPTGINSDSGFKLNANMLDYNYKVKINCFKADLTITISAPKVGMIIHSKSFNPCGNIRIATLDVGKHEYCNNYLLEESDTLTMLPRRPVNSHKYTFGKVVILAGSTTMPGAAVLTANAAIKMGAGLVYLASPSFHSAIIPAIIQIPLDSKTGVINPKHIPTINENIENADAIIIGPGITQHADTIELVRKIVLNNLNKN